MATAQQITELAESLKEVLRADQYERITRIASTLSDEQRDKLFAKLNELQAANIAKMKHEIDVRQRMQGEYAAYQKQEQASANKEAEAADQATADAEAERLLEELNHLN